MGSTDTCADGGTRDLQASTYLVRSLCHRGCRFALPQCSWVISFCGCRQLRTSKGLVNVFRFVFVGVLLRVQPRACPTGACTDSISLASLLLRGACGDCEVVIGTCWSSAHRHCYSEARVACSVRPEDIPSISRNKKDNNKLRAFGPLSGAPHETDVSSCLVPIYP